MKGGERVDELSEISALVKEYISPETVWLVPCLYALGSIIKRSIRIDDTLIPGILCLVGVLLFSVLLGWLPSQGMYEYGVFTGVGDVLRHLALPAGGVCVSGLGELVKQTRSACLESLGEDYILTARAKGLGERAVMVRHAFRGALTPVLTTVLGHIPHIIGGSVVVEHVSAWPGMGSLLFWGIENRDYPVVMGVTVVIALAVLLPTLLLDLAYGLADPRVRYGRG